MGSGGILYLTLLEHFCFRFGTADKMEEERGRERERGKRKGEGEEGEREGELGRIEGKMLVQGYRVIRSFSRLTRRAWV